MRFRPVLNVAFAGLAAATLARPARAQDETQNARMADGLTAGDYVRVHGGLMSPVNAQGSLKNWNSGSTFGLAWENWQPSSGGVGIVGFGIGADYSTLPLNATDFQTRFSGSTNGNISAVSGSNAHILQVGLTTRFRIPSPFAMPSLSVGFGFLDWRPGVIHYTSDKSPGTTVEVAQQHRSGASLSLSGAVDKRVYDRFAVFGEASWVYGFTGYGSGLATPTGVCSNNGCDILKNTSVGVVRGGLRVRAGR